MNIQALATDWIEAQRNHEDTCLLVIQEAVSDAIDLEIDDPEALWEFILELLSRDNISDLISFIAVGPLEELINLYGSQFLDKIRNEIKRNPNLKEALKSVWVGGEVKPSIEDFTKLGCAYVSARAT